MRVDEDTIAIRSGEELDVIKVEHYLREHIEGIPGGKLEVRQFPSGASNLTYLIRIGDWECVLRRPPLGPVPPKAHDIVREALLLQKIASVFPLAPRPYAICNDPDVLGVPFSVMERRRGVVVNASFPPGVTPTPELCRAMSETTIDTLVQIHAIDWQTAGIKGHPDGFLERQVTAWIERYYRSQTDDIPEVEPLVQWLTMHIPSSPPATLIHNDFKLNNMLLRSDDLSQVTAVLDWEMATIGDPLFDLAITLGYWVSNDDPEDVKNVLPTVTPMPGFLHRDQMMELYAKKSGREPRNMDFYMTFIFFKLVVIVQQIYARWKRGQTKDPRFAIFGSRVYNLVIHASRLAGLR
jgi:aminoglycoside phosphotransferase (APT) family kinase protein